MSYNVREYPMQVWGIKNRFTSSQSWFNFSRGLTLASQLSMHLLFSMVPNKNWDSHQLPRGIFDTRTWECRQNAWVSRIYIERSPPHCPLLPMAQTVQPGRDMRATSARAPSMPWYLSAGTGSHPSRIKQGMRSTRPSNLPWAGRCGTKSPISTPSSETASFPRTS